MVDSDLPDYDTTTTIVPSTIEKINIFSKIVAVKCRDYEIDSVFIITISGV